MADDKPGEWSIQLADDTGSKDRATVALVDAKVDGLRELIRAEFANVKEDVKALAAIVSDVIKQGIKIDDHERRLGKLEDGNAGADHERRIGKLEADKTATRVYRQVHLPTIVIAAMATLVSIAVLVNQLVH